MKPVRREMVQLEFVGYGTQAEVPDQDTGGRDRLYLDVGNHLGPGVIDHHHLAACTCSATSLVLEHPDLLVGSLRPDRQQSDPFTVVLHDSPDLDCLASAYLAIALLTTGALPEGSEALARYVDEVDAGYLGLSQDKPYALYSAYMLLSRRLGQRNWGSREAMWRRLVQQGLDVVAYVMEKVARERAAILDVDAFDCPEHFGPVDREEIAADLARYRRKVAAPECRAQKSRLRLPRLIGGTAEVDALFIRDVQNDDDPDRVAFFKDWARTDKDNSPSGMGFVALSIFESTSRENKSRGILSVTPQSRVCLRDLGTLLDEAEAVERISLFGCDDRVEDPLTHEHKPPREGYDNADPWYNGRAHMYTIVDSPRSGTRLSADRIEEIFFEFGEGKDTDVKALTLPSPAGLSDSMEPDSENLQRMTAMAESYREQKGSNLISRPLDVFISYPRARLAWVVENVYEPLKQWRGAKRIFFDMEAIQAGAGWLATLAEAVYECRVFLPVFCGEFFHSDFCQWELQLAVKRDPIGDKRIVVPVMIEAVSLPRYCSLIQVADATRIGIKDRITAILSGVLVD